MKNYLIAAGLLLATLTSSQALVLSFDSGPLISGTGDPLSSTFRIDFATLETEDVNGDPLPRPSWTIDPVPAVTAGSPTAAGWGPSTSNALDVRDQPVMFTFTTPVTLTSFSVVLDNSTLGNLGTEQIQFFDSADLLVRALNVNQSTPGFVASFNASSPGVKKIVLPTAGFYDNMNLGAVPEPSLTLLTGLGALGLGLRRRRGN